MTEPRGRTFSSLRNRNFRLYLVGQSVSQAGTWMQTVALGWLVLRLTGSGSLLGLVTACQFVPTLLLGAFAGAVSDRRSRWHILQATQVLAGLLALVIAVMVVTDTIQLWSLFVLAAAFGTVNAFDVPVRSAFVYELVGPEELTNAVGVGSTANNVARIAGPALAGVLIALVGLGSCFFANAASYVVCIVAFLMLRRGEFLDAEPQPRSKGQVREGLALVWRTPRLRTPLLMTLAIGTLAYENQISLPLIAKYTFGGDAGSYGVLSSAMGVGSVLGGLVVARSGRSSHRRLGVAALILGLTMLAASVMPTFGTMVVAIVVVGAASIGFITMGNTTIQLAAPTAMRGRVMALYVTAIIGSTPVGGPIIGWIGQTIGPRFTLVVGGLGSVVTAVVAWRSLGRVQAAELEGDEEEIERLATYEAEITEADQVSSVPVVPTRDDLRRAGPEARSR